VQRPQEDEPADEREQRREDPGEREHEPLLEEVVRAREEAEREDQEAAQGDRFEDPAGVIQARFERAQLTCAGRSGRQQDA
jgi:hypothetical protein